MESIVIITSDSEVRIHKDHVYDKLSKQIQEEIDKLVLSQILSDKYLSEAYGFDNSLIIK